MTVNGADFCMLKIKWLGQSGYILSDDKTTICIDPYLSDVVNKVANRPRTRCVPVKPEDLKADCVICTHNHLDHIDTDAIPLMNKKIEFYAPEDCEDVLKDLGVILYNPFGVGAKYKIGDFEIEAVFADHTVPAVGVLIKYDDTVMYFSGDTYYNKKLESIKCDIMFICINGQLGNMNVLEAVKLANIIKPSVAVPNHYDMFESNSEDPSKFTNNVETGFTMEFNKEYILKDKKMFAEF